MSINNLPFCSASDRNKAMCRTLPMTTLCTDTPRLCTDWSPANHYNQQLHLPTFIIHTAFKLFYWQKKSRLFQTFRTPMKNFPGPFRSRECLNIKKNGIYLQYSECSPLQKIHQHSTLYLSQQQSTQTGCYTIAACFPFKPLENARRSRIFFQDFPGL